jgi:hypothetical protein
MESLKIRTGAINLEILGDDGVSRGIFTFNPDDIESAKQVFAIQQEYEVKQKEFEERAKACETPEDKINLMSEVVDYMENSIDRCFGNGSSEILFGKAKTLSMFEDFFNGIIPYYQNAKKARISKYTQNK